MVAADVFARTSGPRNARIAIVGESEGVEERDSGRPFVGAAGQLLDQMLAEAGIRREDCFVTNVVRARPPANDMQQFFESGTPTLGGLRPGELVIEGVRGLYSQLDSVKPDLVIAAGNYALWALTEHAGSGADGPRPRVPTGIGDWRGSQVWRLRHGIDDRTSELDPGLRTPVLPIMHPAAILRDWTAKNPTVHDLRKRVPLALAGKWSAEARSPRLDLTPCLEFDRAMACLELQSTAVREAAVEGRVFELCCDIETWKSTLITCVGIAPSPDWAFSIPLVRMAGVGRAAGVESFWSPREEALLTRALAALLSDPSIGWIGQNFLYDRAFLWEWWRVEPRLSWDTLVGQNLLFPGTQKDLGYLASIYCRHYRFWKRDSRDWTEDKDGLGLETHLRYNAEDCARTFEVAVEQRKALAAVDRTESRPEGRLSLWGFELEKIALAWEMQRRGMRVDAERRAKLALELVEAQAALGSWLERIVPQAVLDSEGATPDSGTRWYDSPKQTAVLFYEVLGLKLQRNRKTGSVSTDDEAVNALREAAPRLGELFEALLDYRSLGVIFSTFVESKLEPDGKFRSFFNPAGTATFRFSSSKNPFRRGGNFQNLMAGEEA